MNYIDTRDPSVGVRRSGWVLVVLGLVLALGMGYLTALLAPRMLRQSDGFTGTAEQGVTFVVLFVLVLLFGINAFIGGIVMVKTGRRSRWSVGVMIGLIMLIAGVAFNIFSMTK